MARTLHTPTPPPLERALTDTRPTPHDHSTGSVTSLDRNGVDHPHANSGASEWLRPSYGRSQPEAPTQEGEGRPVMPRARAHAASPAQHREGAALGEEKPDTSAAPSAAANAQTAAPRPLRATEIAAKRRKPKRRTRDAANLKNDKITVRFNPEEAAALRQRAGELGISVSAYIARKALAEDGAIAGSRDEQLDAAIDELAATRPQLAGIGRNINQIAHLGHMGIAQEPGPARDAFIAGTVLANAVREAVADIDRTGMRLAKAGSR
ncbi:plasmid mobilization protein [Kitasatospora sp. NPDC048296]|uniref:plasmid mobilization protein n=1 Tax=Kitasatospora sp. NPDC048296 TaxID=3364048 RepID=UPI0037145486